jgi:hypothetical protein
MSPHRGACSCHHSTQGCQGQGSEGAGALLGGRREDWAGAGELTLVSVGFILFSNFSIFSSNFFLFCFTLVWGCAVGNVQAAAAHLSLRRRMFFDCMSCDSHNFINVLFTGCLACD